jgi:hypothetical protein
MSQQYHAAQRSFRYVQQSKPVERPVFGPTVDKSPPAPDWELDPWFEGTLPADDPARDPGHPSAPSIPQS